MKRSSKKQLLDIPFTGVINCCQVIVIRDCVTGGWCRQTCPQKMSNCNVRWVHSPALIFAHQTHYLSDNTAVLVKTINWRKGRHNHDSGSRLVSVSSGKGFVATGWALSVMRALWRRQHNLKSTWKVHVSSYFGRVSDQAVRQQLH